MKLTTLALILASFYTTIIAQSREDTVRLIGEIPLIVLDGTKKELKDYRTKYTLIDFWGLGCKPCIANTPKLVALQEKYADILTIVGINDSLLMEKMDKFLEDYHINYDIVHIDRNRMNGDKKAYMNAYYLLSNGEFYGWPFYILLDRDGNIIERHAKLQIVENMFAGGKLK